MILLTLPRISELLHEPGEHSISSVSIKSSGVSDMAEVGHCPDFVAKNGNVVHISADSDTQIVNETKISISEVRKTEIVKIIVTDIGNYRS